MATSMKAIDKAYLLQTLKDFDAKILEEKYLQETAAYTIKKLDTAEEGYLASYQLIANEGTEDEAVMGDTINLPKDYLVTAVSAVQTVTEADKPVVGYKVGDKYVDFTVNTKDGSGTESHLYVNLSELFNPFSDGDGIAISEAGEISTALGEGLTFKANAEGKKEIVIDFEDTAIDFATEWGD